MKSRLMPQPAKLLPLAIASAACIFSAAPGVRAQSPPTRQRPMRDLSASERDIRALELEAAPKKSLKSDPTRVNSILAEINKDIDRLRAINAEALKIRKTEAALDLKAVAEVAAEIRKHAARLDKNLTGLPKPEKGEKRQKDATPTDDARIKASFKSLNEALTSFLANPIFRMHTLDVKFATKARQDLNGILSLSEAVRKGAESLAKH